MPPKAAKSMSFEQSMARLEEISARLDNPETGLEETICLVEEGLKLVRSGRALLENAELRIKVLESSADARGLNNSAETSQNDEHDFTLV